MWLEKYNNLTNAEKERFSKVACYLLSKNYVTREIYENKDKIGKINADYRFIERYFDIFSDYLKVINFNLKINETYGFIYLENDFGYNKLRVDKLTTLVLFTLRNIYDEEKEKNTISNVVYLTVGSLVYKLLELNIVAKKPTMKDISDTLRLLVNQNVIARIEGLVDESTCLIAILPTITHIVSNEKIDAIYSMIYSENEEETVEHEVGEEIFNL